LDLDPKGAPFAHVVKVARALHQILTKLRLESFIKTSGASGLHILLPLGARYTHEQSKNFARLLAILGTESVPDISTIARPMAARGGKVYIAFGQNGYGVTIAAPFAARPLPGATVSCPLAWEEVNGRLHPSRFTIKTMPARFQKMKDPMAPIFRKGIDLASALKAGRKNARGPREYSIGIANGKRPGASAKLDKSIANDIVTGRNDDVGGGGFTLVKRSTPVVGRTVIGGCHAKATAFPDLSGHFTFCSAVRLDGLDTSRPFL